MHSLFYIGTCSWIICNHYFRWSTLIGFRSSRTAYEYSTKTIVIDHQQSNTCNLRTTHEAEIIEPWNTQQVSLSTRIMFIRPNPFFRVWEFRVARTHASHWQTHLPWRNKVERRYHVKDKKKWIRKINCICVRSSRRLHKSSQCHAHTLCIVWLC